MVAVAILADAHAVATAKYSGPANHSRQLNSRELHFYHFDEYSLRKPPLVEWDFAPQVLRLFEGGSTTEYRVAAVPVYASSLPNPTSRARTIAWARSTT